MNKQQIEEKLTQLANATKTYYQAGGHTKAENNKWAMKHLIEELEAEGVKIPSDQELLAIGVFNGEGAV